MPVAWSACGIELGTCCAHPERHSVQDELVVALKTRLDVVPSWLKQSVVTAIGGPNSMRLGL